MELELVTFKICPFGQRPLVTLLYKQVAHRLTYITPDALPEWFAETSPLGKVPLLKVDGKAVIFESAVINEFIDEISGGGLLPTEPLARALNRAWIEYASACLGDMHGMSTAADEAAFTSNREGLLKKLAYLEKHLAAGPYFNGAEFSLVDSAFGPFFQRVEFLNHAHEFLNWADYPKTAAWAQTLLDLPAMRDALPEDFAERYRMFLGRQGGYAAGLFVK